MDRTAVFVDAGYLFAQGSFLLAGAKLKRSETFLDQEKLISFLDTLAGTLTKLPLLRIYWYDGTDSGPSPFHTTLAFRPYVKLRLGIVNSYGQQKGVDSLIVSDLINLSRNRAMSDVVLITGDEDIRVGVQQAQEIGVRVHLVGIEPVRDNQSNLLRQEADTLHEISKTEVQTFLTRAPQPQAAPLAATMLSASTTSASGPALLQDAAVRAASSLSKDEVALVANDPTGRVPPDIDRQLLHAASRSPLTDPQKRSLRQAFIAACKSRM